MEVTVWLIQAWVFQMQICTIKHQYGSDSSMLGDNLSSGRVRLSIALDETLKLSKYHSTFTQKCKGLLKNIAGGEQIHFSASL